jgi:(1->4)-alpha-D-glucan 1-alpha-D-glucosylmutase
MIPRATYRIQFGKEFGFADAAAIAPYLSALGISHVYTSPYLRARPGSKHGYDITDHNALNHELGDDEAFQHMLAAFRENNLQHILDYVPNHMGVGGSDNPFWLDVLEWGRESPYASWFDVDWDSYSEYLSGKLLIPFLGDQYGAELESGKIQLKFDAERGEFSVWLYDTHKLPITPPSYPAILGDGTRDLERLADEFNSLPRIQSETRGLSVPLKAKLAELVATNEQFRASIDGALASFRGEPGKLDTWAKLDALVREQHWRPTHFRVAADDINYRRFFNISELAGIRMELPSVFEHTHRLVIELLKNGSLQGLRIDHIDGLYNPKEYLERLRASAGSPFYLVVEKILAAHESLRADWPVDGTTGYDFCGQVTGLMIDPAVEDPLTEFYEDFTGECDHFPDIVRACKIKIMENEMASELETLSRDAVSIARQNPRTTDFTQNILRRALKETIACFPVYRTYVDGAEHNQVDQRYIHWAISQALKNERELDPSVFEFLKNLLTGQLADQSSSGFSRHSVIRFAMRAQQVSGPVMAKGLEDTALYRYNRFIALNEVGSSPGQFGLSVAAFHKENQHRAEEWPHTMLATSTHDVKHGEDARARLAALSLVPDEWTTKVAGWSRILRARRGDVEGTAPPVPNDEYLFFQNLVATWPADLTLPCKMDRDRLNQYADRLQQAMTKSLREGRIRSNWISPDVAYETAVSEFIRDALNPDVSATFLDNFLPFQQRIAELGVRNSLVQLVLKITSPGLPDFYQGSDLWDLNLPDPDNRRLVDFELRRKLLASLDALKTEDRLSLFSRLLQNWHDGAIKLAVAQLLLSFRRDNASLFESGGYEPLLLGDEDAQHRICAFARTSEACACVVAVSLDAKQSSVAYSNTKVPLGSSASVAEWRDEVTQKLFHANDGTMDLAEIFSELPFAVLIPLRVEK